MSAAAAAGVTRPHVVVAYATVLQHERVNVLHTTPGGQGSWHQLDLAGIFNVPAHEHRRVLVGGVVAVLHVGASEFPKADRHLDGLTTELFGAYAEDVLAAIAFP